MKSISIAALLLSTSLLVSPVSASATATAAVAQPSASAAAAKPAAGEKKICKQLDMSGSRLPHRACLTAKEWKQIQDDMGR
jgi:hypothetical protein